MKQGFIGIRHRFIENRIWKKRSEELWLDKIRWNIRKVVFDNLFAKYTFEDKWSFEATWIAWDLFWLQIDLGNFCQHECGHCMINATKTWNKMEFESYKEMMKKFHTKMKFIKRIFFMWWEFFDREDWSLFIEEALKRWVNEIDFISRWPSLWTVDEHMKKIIDLKNRYPIFDLDISLSIDGYSPMNNRDEERYIHNLFKLILMQFQIFWKKDVRIKFTVPFENKKETIKHFNNMAFIVNSISFLLEQEWIVAYDKVTDKKDNSDILLFSWWKTLTVHFQWLSKYKWRSEKLKWWLSRNKDRNYNYCKVFDNNPFDIFIDSNFNLRLCTWYHLSSGYWEKVINIAQMTKRKVIKAYLSIKLEMYTDVSYEDVAEYAKDPRWKRICQI